MKGLMWFDNDPKRTDMQKIRAAAARHRERFGVAPTRVEVHAMGNLVESDLVLDGLTLKLSPQRHILPNNYFVGVDDGADRVD